MSTSWLGLVVGGTLAGLVATALSEGTGPAPAAGVHVASNIYSWSVLLAREGRDFNVDLDASVRLVAASGSDGLEPILDSPDSADRFGQALKAIGLQMRSVYVNTTLHERASVEESVARVVSTAKQAREYGTRIIVTNPNPIQWGGPQDKNDDQLMVQAAALNRLGKELARLGMTLAYHNHDAELRQSARELHHVMVGTDPRYVKLCLDAHWIYRGAGGSQVALFDILKLYHKRIVELHVRQSTSGVWSEVFGPGDIDYRRLTGELRRLRVAPHIVLEQAAEVGTPRTMTALDAMRLSTERVRVLFAGVGRR